MSVCVHVNFTSFTVSSDNERYLHSRDLLILFEDFPPFFEGRIMSATCERARLEYARVDGDEES